MRGLETDVADVSRGSTRTEDRSATDVINSYARRFGGDDFPESASFAPAGRRHVAGVGESGGMYPGYQSTLPMTKLAGLRSARPATGYRCEWTNSVISCKFGTATHMFR